MISKLLLMLGVCCLVNSAICQSPTLKTVTLPSPNASSLGKYGDMPVSLYTGIPEISVPLYTVKTRDLELPISVSYHAGGVRLEEIPSNVGCGWSLNIGGVITRSIRGLPDIYTNPTYYQYIATIAKKYSLNNIGISQIDQGNCLTADYSDAISLANSTMDGEPDVYYFNFGKYSGSFFLGESGQFILSPKDGIKIESKQILTYTQDVAQWILTTPDGVQYVFGVSKDETRSALEKNANGEARDPIVSWYLLDIISPTLDQIQLTYSNLTYSYYTRAGETLNQLLSTYDSHGASLPAHEIKTTLNNITEPRISSITFPTGEITVTSSNDRSDLTGCKSVDQISIYNHESLTTPIKKISFTYDYSLGSRLTLKGIEELSGTSTSNGNKYAFAYNTLTNLPARNISSVLINSQDIWGFYNGANNTVFPATSSYTENGVLKFITGADRHADAEAMKAGVLTSITYPTGGKTEFEFEANSVYSNQTFDGIPLVPTTRSVFLNYGTGETKTINFTVADAENGKANVQISNHSQLAGCPIQPYGGNSICNNAYIEGINGTLYYAQFLPEGSSSQLLPNGSYKLVGQGIVINGQPTNSFYVKLDWNEYPQLGTPQASNKVIGGLRILRIKNKDAQNNTLSLKKYLYTPFNDNTVSSGVLVNFPALYPNYYYAVGYSLTSWGQNLYAQAKSVPLVPLTPTGGSTIGYENVTELEGENGENGKTEYTFTTAKDSRDLFGYTRPFAPPISYEFRRGKLKLETVYKNISGTFSPVRSTYNQYTFDLNGEIGYGVVAQYQNAVVVEGPNSHYLTYPFYYYVASTQLISEFLHLSQRTTRTYNQADPLKYVETTNDFTYDLTKGHYQLIKSVTSNSKKQVIETNMKYPQDITLTGTAETARQAMVTNHIWSPILQQNNLVDNILTSQTNNYYKVFSNGFALPESIETKIGTSNPDKRLEFLNYDAFGNILGQHKVNDVINSYIWDYSGNYPIAEVKNAISSDIAHTSFEADGAGNFNAFTGSITTVIPDVTTSNMPPTGKNFYNLTSTSAISKSGLIVNKIYIISYWRNSTTPYSVTGGTAVSNGYKMGKTINGWTYHEHKITATSATLTITGTGAIDETRLYPDGAEMTTCTYHPLIGMSSQCDINNRITYYDYDVFGRLRLIRDQDKKILKRFDYQYQQPQ